MSRLLRRTLPPLLLAGFLVPTAPAAGATCAGATAAPSSLSASTAKRVTLCLLNRERYRHGLRPLHSNPRLERAARGHSHDMVASNLFSHASSDGGGLVGRVRRAGYLSGAHGWTVGENIGWGQSSLASPATMVRMWMHSSGHRANILKGSYRDIGIGIIDGTPVRGGGQGTTYTTDFGSRG
jgi:uncharacterized protein YkwD